MKKQNNRAVRNDVSVITHIGFCKLQIVARTAACDDEFIIRHDCVKYGKQRFFRLTEAVYKSERKSVRVAGRIIRIDTASVHRGQNFLFVDNRKLIYGVEQYP